MRESWADKIINIDGTAWFESELDALTDKWLNYKPAISDFRANDYNMARLQFVINENPIYRDYIHRLNEQYKEIYGLPELEYYEELNPLKRCRDYYVKIMYKPKMCKDWSISRKNGVDNVVMETYLVPEVIRIIKIELPYEFEIL